jgi:hypothetical protein
MAQQSLGRLRAAWTRVICRGVHRPLVRQCQYVLQLPLTGTNSRSVFNNINQIQPHEIEEESEEESDDEDVFASLPPTTADQE